MHVTLSELIREQALHLVDCGKPLTGYIYGWQDVAQKIAFGIRLQLSATIMSEENSISSGLEVIGWFSVLNADITSCKGSQLAEDGPFISLKWLKQANGGVEMEVFDERSQTELSSSFQATASLYQQLRNNFVIISTSVCPELVYLNHNEERSPVRAIENVVARFIDDLYLSSFIAEGPASTRIISLASSASLSVAQFCRPLLPPEPSGSKRTKNISPSPTVLDFQILKSKSASNTSTTAVSIRYDAIRPSEPSLDDSTHDLFEKNAKVFHAFYPRLSVITYIQKNDNTSGSMAKALQRHINAIVNQLNTHIVLYQKLDEVAHLEPFHFALGPESQNEIVTLLYEVPAPSLDWQSEYAARLEYPSKNRDSFGVDYAISLPLPGLEAGKTALSKEASRNSSQDSASSSTAGESNKLAEIHKLVPSPGSDYEVHLVKGAYEYYHYCQDGFDDKGWGCAYRSMQTIVSWIIKQHLSIKAVPSHVEIQRMLVDMLDKPPSFVNSKQWIGAVEISMCLSQHWDISCKILHSQDGTKVSSYLKDLVNHFDTLGSPIMAGGSVLAYTILGVAVNVVNPLLPNGQPDVKYLILDPHYSGSELPQTIISNGWCAWKPPTVWKKDAFYNLCVPQTPKWADLR